MSVAALLLWHPAPEWRSSGAGGPEPWASSSPPRAPLAECLLSLPRTIRGILPRNVRILDTSRQFIKLINVASVRHSRQNVKPMNKQIGTIFASLISLTKFSQQWMKGSLIYLHETFLRELRAKFNLIEIWTLLSEFCIQSGLSAWGGSQYEPQIF